MQQHSGLFKAAAGSDVVPFLAGSEQSTGCLLKLGSLQRQRASLFNIPQRQLCMSYVCCWKAEERDEQSQLFLRMKHSNCCSVETEKLWINSQKLHCTTGFSFAEGCWIYLFVGDLLISDRSEFCSTLHPPAAWRDAINWAFLLIRFCHFR